MNTLKGRVARRSFVGAQTDYVIDVNGVPLRVISPSRNADYQLSQDVLVSFCAGGLPAARRLKQKREKTPCCPVAGLPRGHCSVVPAPRRRSRAVQSMDELYAAAKKEGQVVFGGAIKAEHVTKLAAAFNKRYPGIAVKYTRRSTEPMVQLVEAERRANRVSFDVLNLTEPGDVGALDEAGLPRRGADPGHRQDAARRPSIPTASMPRPASRRCSASTTPRCSSAGEAPKSLKALVSDPKWKGKVAISRPTRGGTSSGALMNVVDAVGRDFLKTARDRDILLTLGNEAAINAVVSGERPVSWGVSGYRAIEARADGSPIEVIVWEEGVALAQFIGVVPAKAPHPNAARLFYRWLMTPEGQELLVTNANFYSPRKDVAVTPLKQPPLSAMQDQLFQQREGRQRRPRAGARVRQGGGAVTRHPEAPGTRYHDGIVRTRCRLSCRRAIVSARFDELRQEWLRSLIVGAAVLIVGWLVFYPLGIIFEMGLRAEDGSLHARALLSRVHRARAWSRRWSIRSSSASRPPALRSLLALPMAWAVARTDMPGRQFVRVSVLVAFVIPNFISVIAWILLLGPNAGLINVFVRETFGIARALQHLQHGRPGAGADASLLPADLLRGHRGARQHGPILRGGGADGRRAGLAGVDGHRAAAGAAGDRRVVGVRVPGSHGRVRRAGRDRSTARVSIR